jgi:methanogenic corrinoid protein MtbC1
MDTTDISTVDYIKSNNEKLAKDILKDQLELQKSSNYNSTAMDEDMILGGIKYQLLYLSESIEYSTPELFLNALEWGKSYMGSLGLDSSHIVFLLNSIKNTLSKSLPEEARDVALGFIDKGLADIKEYPDKIPSFITDDNRYKKEAKKYLDLLIDSKRSDAGKMILDMAENGVPVKDIYLDIFQMTQYEVGRLWQIGKITVAQEHYCTAATQLIMSQLYDYIFQSENFEKTFIGTCVSGELHEIGIRMLSDLLEMEGWDTYYLGANMPPESIVESIISEEADLVGISATMTFHLSKAEKLIKTIRAEPKCDRAKIIVGGYVFNMDPGLYKKIGADTYGRDLEESIKKANAIVKNK